jgi:hypothetical protein
MSQHDDAEGCRPAFIDLETGQPLPYDHPTMVKIMAIWETTSRAQREAYHRVMCLNSRDAIDLMLVKTVIDRFRD